VFVGLVACIPYTGAAIQKDMHDIVALLFALSAVVGFAFIAKRLQNYTLGSLSGTMFGVCVLELIFLARYKAHPVQSWVWTVLELAAIASLIAALGITVKTLEQKTKLS
jgi:predicted membrane protein